jgi:Zn-dependent peptidase ImmA (M78 family)
MQFNVYGQKIIVKKIKNLRSTGAYGTYNPKTKQIEIDASLKGELLVHTLLHELIHALCDRLGYHNAMLSHDLEELIADNIPSMLLENFTVKRKCNKQRK